MAEFRSRFVAWLGPACRSAASPDPAEGPWRDGRFLRVGLVFAGVVWFLYAMLNAQGLSGPPYTGLRGTDLWIAGGAFAGAGCFILGLVMRWRSSEYGWIFFLVGAGIGAALYIGAAKGPSSTLILACVGFTGSAASLPRSGSVAVVGSVGMLVGVLVQGRPAGELWTIVGMLGMFVGIRAGHMREAARQTERQNLILAERSRIAREIHDILAHSLSAQLVHLEGARLLMVSGRMDEALGRVERARGLARSGLEETRRALATLRGDIPPMDVVLRELTDEHRLLADAVCELKIEGEPRELEAKASLAVIRTAQEALTNTRKHAPGAAVMVALRYIDGWCELEVTDAGGEPGPLAGSGGGYGLVGMRERAELIGGTLEAGPVEEGFKVLLRVPL
ncbi:sensor histidine kinase [Actinoallomurus acaciae]|uniref:histidine kinase n=1 Tax=Actinoallomurus acaciae TaxID=502577 RepID=A0ABV5YD85_9ACTN